MDDRYSKELGKRIQQLRRARSLTQEQLSAQMQVCGCELTRSAIAKIEVGQRHVYPDELKMLHQVLQVTYDDLLP